MMNTSQVEIKEYLDYINMMIPQGEQGTNKKLNDSRHTFMSAGLGEEDHSLITFPSEMSSLLNLNSMIHSRILAPEKENRGGLQVVAEHEKEEKELSGMMLEGLNEDSNEEDLHSQEISESKRKENLRGDNSRSLQE